MTDETIKSGGVTWSPDFEAEPKGEGARLQAAPGTYRFIVGKLYRIEEGLPPTLRTEMNDLETRLAEAERRLAEADAILGVIDTHLKREKVLHDGGPLARRIKDYLKGKR